MGPRRSIVEEGALSTRVSYQRDDLEFARAVTFFDAIFAFAVTLLITTVDDISPEAWSSFQALKESNGSSLLAFAISFVVVVSFWRANHQEVTGFTALDGRVIFLNCAVMFGVVLIPFATEALGKLDNLPLPVAVYAIVISGTFLMQHLVVFVADQRGLRTTRMTRQQRNWEIVDAAILPLVFLGSIPLAYLVSPQAAEQSWISLVVIMPLVGMWQQRSDKAPAAAAPIIDKPIIDKEAE
jgi:uncharacterized membrane protein